MSEKRMLADVLWEAANVHLNAEPDENLHGQGVHKWSCWAVARALELKPWQFESGEEQPCEAPGAMEFLESIGLDASCRNLFSRLPRGIQQGVRYMWLLLAMHVAEDEGITV